MFTKLFRFHPRPPTRQALMFEDSAGRRRSSSLSTTVAFIEAKLLSKEPLLSNITEQFDRAKQRRRSSVFSVNNDNQAVNMRQGLSENEWNWMITRNARTMGLIT